MSKNSPKGKAIHRAGRGPVLQIDVARRLLPIGLVRDVVQVPQPVPLGLGRQPQGLSGLARQPVAKGLGLEVIHLDRPVPGHVDDLGHGPQAVAAGRLDPEEGMPGLAVGDPFPAFVRPVVLLFIAPVFDEAEVLPVGNQVAAGREVPDFVFLAAEFVVPAVERVVLRLAQHDAPAGDRQQFVLRRLARFRADAPQRQLPDHFDRQPANDDRGGFHVDPLVLDPHQDDPERIVPGMGIVRGMVRMASSTMPRTASR